MYHAREVERSLAAMRPPQRQRGVRRHQCTSPSAIRSNQQKRKHWLRSGGRWNPFRYGSVSKLLFPIGIDYLNSLGWSHHMIQGRQGERVWGNGGPGHVRPGYVVTDLPCVDFVLSPLLASRVFAVSQSVGTVSQSRHTAIGRSNREPRPGGRVAVQLDLIFPRGSNRVRGTSK